MDFLFQQAGIVYAFDIVPPILFAMQEVRNKEVSGKDCCLLESASSEQIKQTS